MKRMTWAVPVILVVVCSTLSGCATRYGDYSFALKAVERPTATTAKYGEGAISNNYSFEDTMVSLSCIPNDRRTFNLLLKNKTDGSLKVNWDDGAIVDADGVTHQISHSTVKVIDIGRAQPPTMIPKGSVLNDAVFPADKVEWSDLVKDYIILPMVPIGDEQARQGYIGKTIRLILPVENEGVKHEYTFVFELGAPPEKPKSAKAATQ
jgi:hypothetical protein